MAKNNAKFYFVMSGVAFGCFAIAYFLVTYCFIHPQYVKGLLFAIPCAVFLLIAVGVHLGKLGDNAAFLLTLFLIFASVFAVPAWFFYLGLESALTRVEDISYYERILRQTSVDKLCEGLLPEHIPENTEDVYFHYHPQVLQGGASFILSFKTDAASLVSYEEILEEKAIWTGTYAQAMEENRNVLYPFESEEEDWDAYILYVVEASPEFGRGMNHGSSYTVTLNYDTQEIVFDYGRW